MTVGSTHGRADHPNTVREGLRGVSIYERTKQYQTSILPTAPLENRRAEVESGTHIEVVVHEQVPLCGESERWI